MSTHSRFSPSQAYRWLECPGSIRFIEALDLPEEEAGVAAQEGTVAHEVLASRLYDSISCSEGLPAPTPIPAPNDEIQRSVNVALEYFESLRDRTLDFLVERPVSLRQSPVFGTPDVVMITTNPDDVNDMNIWLHVIDLKHGRHRVPVTTPQTKIYALGAIDTYSLRPEMTRLTIIQPHALGVQPGEEINSLDVTPADLEVFRQEIDAAVESALRPDAPLRAGSHCRFCPAAPHCPELRKQALTVAQQEFSALPVIESVPPAPETLPNDVLGDLLSKSPVLLNWVDALRDHAQRELEAGRDVPGFKLAPKATHRRWTSEEDVLAWGQREGVTVLQTSLKSPAQVEKLVGRNKIPAELVTRPMEFRIVPDDSGKRLAAGAQSPLQLTSGGDDE